MRCNRRTLCGVDELADRARRAIADSQALQRERHLLVEECGFERSELRRAVLESAMERAESKARRGNRQP